MARVLGRVVGFVAGAALAVLIEGLLLWFASAIAGRSFVPRGLGWIVVPILAGLAGAKVGPRVLERVFGDRRLEDRRVRLGIAAFGSYLLIWPGFILAFDPFSYGGWWSDHEWWHFLRAVSLPPAMLVVVWALFAWAVRGQQDQRPPG